MDVTDVQSELDIANRLIAAFSSLLAPSPPVTLDAPQLVSTAASHVALLLSAGYASSRPAVLIIDGAEPGSEMIVREAVKLAFRLAACIYLLRELLKIIPID